MRSDDRRRAMERAESEGRVVDSAEVRLELIRRMESGELSLEQVQSELKRIKRGAKTAGKVTRNQAFRGY